MSLPARALTDSDNLDFLQGYVWSLDGHESVLTVWLIEWDAQGHPHKLAGPGNDNGSVTPVFASSTTSPAHTPRSRRTGATNPLPPARFGNSGSLQMGNRAIGQGNFRCPPGPGIMQSQDASSAYPAVGNYATLIRPQICNPGQYSGAAPSSKLPYFDPKGSYSERGLGHIDSGQPPMPPRTVSSASSVSSVCTTFAFPTASCVGEVRVPGPSRRSSGDSPSLSGASTPGPCAFVSAHSASSSTTGGVRIHGRSSIASDDSACSSMVSDLRIFGLSNIPSSVLSSPTTFRRSSQMSTISQPAHGTYELWVHPVPPGTTKETFNVEVLEATLGRYTPHAGITIVDTDEQMQVCVAYHDEEQAKQAAEKLKTVYYMGTKLQACVKKGIGGGVRI